MQLCSSYIRHHHSICAWSQFSPPSFLFSLNLGCGGWLERRLASPIQQWIRRTTQIRTQRERTRRVRARGVCVQLTEMVAAQRDSFHPNDSAENEVPSVLLFVCSLFFASFYFVVVVFYFRVMSLSLSRPLSLMSLRLSADMLSSLFILRGMHGT